MQRRTFLKGVGAMTLPPGVIDRLVVNEADFIRTKRYATLNTGLLEQMELCTTANYEEAWTFIPQRQLWVECGINPNIEIVSGAKRMNVENDQELLDSLYKTYQTLVHTHIHPEYSPERNDPNYFHQMHVSPSSTDITFLVSQYQHYQRLNEKGNLALKVVSALGVTSIELTDQGKQLLPTEYVYQDFGVVDINNQFNKVCFSTSEEDFSKEIANIQSPFFKFTYRPKEEFYSA